MKKPAISAADEPDSYIPPKAGGIGALAGAIVAAAGESKNSKDDEEKAK